MNDITNIAVKKQTLKQFNRLKYSFEDEDLTGDDLVKKLMAIEKKMRDSKKEE